MDFNYSEELELGLRKSPISESVHYGCWVLQNVFFWMPVALVASAGEVIVAWAKDRYPPMWNDLKNIGFSAFKHISLQIRN